MHIFLFHNHNHYIRSGLHRRGRGLRLFAAARVHDARHGVLQHLPAVGRFDEPRGQVEHADVGGVLCRERRKPALERLFSGCARAHRRCVHHRARGR